MGSDLKLRAIISYLSAGVGKHVFLLVGKWVAVIQRCVVPQNSNRVPKNEEFHVTPMGVILGFPHITKNCQLFLLAGHAK